MTEVKNTCGILLENFTLKNNLGKRTGYVKRNILLLKDRTTRRVEQGNQINKERLIGIRNVKEYGSLINRLHNFFFSECDAL